MLKVALALLAVALAGTASAAGWRSLRVDASSEAAFEQSLAEFKDKLSPARRHAFRESLEDIWVAGLEAARAEQREYSQAHFYRQIDGLSYQSVVTLLDPTGATARQYRAAYNPYAAGDRGRYRASTSVAAPSPWRGAQPDAPSGTGPNWRGRTPLTGPGLPQ